MKKELKKQLLANYSDLFNSESPPLFDCGNGWYDLLVEFFDKLRSMEKPDGFKILTVKQKYGGLNVWGRPYSDFIDDMYYELERSSHYVCEECGSRSGVKFITVKGWEQVACYPCRQMLKSGWSENSAQFNDAEKLSAKAILERLMAVCNEEMDARFPGGEVKVVLQGMPKKCHIVVKDAEGRVYAA